MERSDIMATGSINISSNISRNTLLSTYAPKPCTKFIVKNNGNGSALLYWDDPEDYVTADSRKVSWKFTRIVRKLGSYPRNENDGTIVVDSSIRNQYSKTKFIDTGLSNYTTYYYSAFTCSTDNVYNYERVGGSIQVYPWRTMTVVLNLLNSNPAGIGSYSDDAVDMESGSSEWDTFFGHKPCLFKDGKVVGYLNPNDFTKFENGAAADITSGDAGDVMIEFPRRGVRISKSSGSFVTVSMTDNPDDPSFKYYAHQRGNDDKSYFYLGAYIGSVKSDIFRSLSNTSMLYGVNHSTVDMYSKNHGTNYGFMGFYQWLFLQVMYVLRFKGNLNSEAVVGSGQAIAASKLSTGRSNSKGMNYGDKNVVKLFGIEDIWGNMSQLINNFKFGSYKTSTRTDDSSSPYVDRDNWNNPGSIGGKFYTMCIGTSESGFMFHGDSSSGSSSTYFCDYVDAVQSDRFVAVGGTTNGGNRCGIFYQNGVDWNDQYTYNWSYSSRLQYL